MPQYDDSIWPTHFQHVQPEHSLANRGGPNAHKSRAKLIEEAKGEIKSCLQNKPSNPQNTIDSLDKLLQRDRSYKA